MNPVGAFTIPGLIYSGETGGMSMQKRRHLNFILILSAVVVIFTAPLLRSAFHDAHAKTSPTLADAEKFIGETEKLLDDLAVKATGKLHHG